MRIFTLFFLFASLGFAQFEEIEKTNISGNEYYLSMPPAYIETFNPNDFIKFFIFSKVDQKIIVESDNGYFIEIQVKTNQLSEINLTPGEAQPYVFSYLDGDQVCRVTEGKGFKVTGESAFQLHAVTRFQFTSDGTLVLPKNKLGTEYILSPYSSRPINSTSLPNMVTVTATEDNTKIDFTVGGNLLTRVPLENGQVLEPGDSYSWTINEGDVLTLTNAGDNQTLSGSYIKSSKPVNVLSGHYCADIPVGTPACDYNLAQDYPIDNWGYNFLIPKIRARVFSPIIRIFAKEDNTKIFRNGEEIAFLPKGKGGLEDEAWIEMRVLPKVENNVDIAHFSADKPISISLYNPGQLDDNIRSDPFQINLVPVENLGKNLYISSPGTQGGTPFTQNYLEFFIEADENGEIPESAVWGSEPSDSGFKYTSLKNIGGLLDTIKFMDNGIERTFLYKSHEMPGVGSYNMKSENLISAFSYGYANFDSYGNDLSIGIGTEFDDVEFDIDQSQEIFVRNDSLILRGEFLYVNQSSTFLEFENSTEPISFSGQKNEKIIEYVGEYHIEDASEIQRFEFTVTENKNSNYNSEFVSTVPEIQTIYKGELVDSEIDLGNTTTEDEIIIIDITNNDFDVEIVETVFESEYFELISSEKIAESPIKFRIDLSRKSDFETVIDDTLKVNFEFGLSKEIIIKGAYSNAGFSTDYVAEKDSIFPKQSFKGKISLKSSCELPSTESTTISNIKFVGDNSLNIEFDRELPIILEPNQDLDLNFEVSGDTPGDYEFSIDFENSSNEDCSSPAIFEVTILDPSSVELLPDNFLVISPNPAENNLELNLQDNFNGNIRIFDINGNDLLTNKISNSFKTIDISRLTTGNYFIEISNNEYKITKQFVKK